MRLLLAVAPISYPTFCGLPGSDKKKSLFSGPEDGGDAVQRQSGLRELQRGLPHAGHLLLPHRLGDAGLHRVRDGRLVRRRRPDPPDGPDGHSVERGGLDQLLEGPRGRHAVLSGMPSRVIPPLGATCRLS